MERFEKVDGKVYKKQELTLREFTEAEIDEDIIQLEAEIAKLKEAKKLFR